jgi:hypothetical protein
VLKIRNWKFGVPRFVTYYSGSSLIARVPNIGLGGSHRPTVSSKNVLHLRGIACDEISYVSETAIFDKQTGEPPSWLLDMESRAQAIINCRQTFNHIFQDLKPLREVVEHQGQAAVIQTLTDCPWLEELWFRGMEKNMKLLWEIFFGRAKVPEKISEQLSNLPKQNAKAALFNPLSTALLARLDGRKLFTTVGGLIGVESPSIRQRDVIVFIFGTRVPMILRPRLPEEGYKFVGFAYAAGLSELDLCSELYGRVHFTETTFEIY